MYGVIAEPSFVFECGVRLFDLKDNPFLDPKSTNIFHVKQAMTCGMPIELQYFAAKETFPPIYAICGNPNNHVDTEEDDAQAQGRKARRICQDCFDSKVSVVTPLVQTVKLESLAANKEELLLRASNRK